MNDLPTLPDFLELGWASVYRARDLTGMAVHHPVLTTWSAENGPQGRTVVMRVADRMNGEVEAQTDFGSAKVCELKREPRAQMVIWDPEVLLQIRLSVDVEILTGDATGMRWDLIPDGSRKGYGARPVPGTPISTPFDYVKPGDFAGFAVLRCVIREMELMQLEDPHRRAVFMREDGWRGTWVVP